jgi:uncharacterized protein YbaP (TraB family)
MIRKLFFYTLICFTSHNLQAQAPADTTHTLLWKISGNGLKQPSYVFGTMHVICNADFYMPDSAKAAADRAKQFVFEIDLDDYGMMQQIMAGKNMNGNTRLADLMKPAQYDSLGRFLKDSLAMDIADHTRTKPLLLGGVLMQNMLRCETASYELYFLVMAMTNSSSINGLETVKEQAGFMDSIPYKKQAEMLLQSMREFSKSKKELQELIHLYKTQDVQALQAGFEEKDGGLADFQPLLLSDRNKRWIPQLEKYMKTEPAFIAVGAGHLGGKEGVLQLLRDKGYVVEPVK